MKVTGIIAEYNPFHRGHQYQIETLHRQHCPDFVIAVMSGDFVQRGGPAVLDKYARTEMALCQGIDLVLELPVRAATASASHFAREGVRLLAATGLVDSLCFGVEGNAPLSRMQELASILEEEPPWFQRSLRFYIKEGFAYPDARAKALPEYADLLRTPNNILGVEYLRAILRYAPSLVPLPIDRSGSGHHETATAIREALLQRTAMSPLLSETSANIIKRQPAFFSQQDFSLLLHHALLGQTPESLIQYSDMSESLANRIFRNLDSFRDWDSFCELCKTKNITYTRVSRTLCHILLNLKKMSAPPLLPPVPYLRVLGFRASAAPLLTHLSDTAQSAVIHSLAQDARQLSPGAQESLREDLYAADLYRSVRTAKTGITYPNEYRHGQIIIKLQ